MTGIVIFDPLIPLTLLLALAILSGPGVIIALRFGLGGWAWRAMACLVLLVALANPAYQQENRAALSDIVIAIADESASQSIGARPDQITEALAHLQSEIDRRPNTELRVASLGDGDGNTGTLLMTALSAALAQEPQGRVAGMVLISDGNLHDLGAAPPSLPAPLHLLMTGTPEDWDRRIVVQNAPAFAIMGEPVTLSLRIEDQGAAPAGQQVPLTISIDGAPPMGFEVPINQEIELPINLPHGGINVLQFSTPFATGELTDRNNEAVVQINGVRDRLRVLLVSGEPHAGERTWRNLLKSDAAVDLVHFTILRPPEKQDGVPVNELSLIAFPTRELFLEKIDEFDLIIFDRYKRRGILPTAYLENVARYVRNGGAVLVSAGPDYASADSIFRSPLGEVLPGRPTARVIEEGFLPLLTDLGTRHPVTEGLENLAPTTLENAETPGWGRWLRQIEVEPSAESQIVMEGAEGLPLLMLERVEQGRVALIASDHAWLWDRGFEGGGPQLELLRRLAHWMMREPELEEETLRVEPNGLAMRIIRRSLEDQAGPITIVKPDGETEVITLNEATPGQHEAIWQAPEMGLYRLSDENVETVIALGPAAPREFEQTIAHDADLADVVTSTQGGLSQIHTGLPTLREVRAGRPAAGPGWIGITPRGAYRTQDLRLTSLMPSWLALLLCGALILTAWIKEGRR